MRSAKTSLALCLALLCGGCGLPQLSVGGGPARVDPGWTTFGGVHPGYWPGHSGISRGYRDEPRLVCDQFGRCWRRDSDRWSDRGRRPAEPPGWAENLPDAARERDRFIRPSSDLVCDQATRVCYKRGNVDKSDTKEVFGRRAAKRADQLRDERGTARIFVPDHGVACDRERQRCFSDGDPDRSLTRRHFGRDAARDVR